MSHDILITRLAEANPVATSESHGHATESAVDPLEERLLAAVAREPQPPRARPGGAAAAAWRRAHPVAFAFACVLLCASAAAAIVSLTGQASKPLAGLVPGSHTPRARRIGAESLAGDAYRITVAPDLEAGDAGWCTDITYTHTQNTRVGAGKAGHLPAVGSGGGCETGGSYPTSGRPLFGSLAHWGSPAGAPKGDSVDYVLTGPHVAAIRVGSSTILTRSQPGLPKGDRAAVFFLPANAGPVMVPPVGTPYPYDFRVPDEDPYLVHLSKAGRALPPAHPPLVRATPILALNAAGQVIRSGDKRGSSQGTVRFWQRHPSRTLRAHGITGAPRHGACEVARSGGPALKGVFGRTVERIVPRPTIEGQAFLSCLNAYYEDSRSLVQVAVLLDAREPGQTLSSIPGAKAVPGQPKTVDVALGTLPGAITARREQNAWLVIQGGQSETQRLEILQKVRITKIARSN